jgi:hypothetical protein
MKFHVKRVDEPKSDLLDFFWIFRWISIGFPPGSRFVNRFTPKPELTPTNLTRGSFKNGFSHHQEHRCCPPHPEGVGQCAYLHPVSLSLNVRIARGRDELGGESVSRVRWLRTSIRTGIPNVRIYQGII